MTVFCRQKQLSRSGLSYYWPIWIVVWLCSWPQFAPASPEQDLAEFREFYRRRFPNLKLSDYADGVYAIDPIARKSWAAIEEFPPYESAIDIGKTLFARPFPDGKFYTDCFPRKGLGIANRYPYWDVKKRVLITLPVAINDCRTIHREEKIAYDSPEMNQLTAYMAYTTRGKPIDIEIPKDDPYALAAYEKGKSFYYRRQGQLNFACATCHVQNAGKKLRAETLGASLGHTNNWPAYRLKWGEIGSLHRRFAECLTQIKARPLPEQSEEFRNLEYYLSYMSQGVPVTGPSTRK